MKGYFANVNVPDALNCTAIAGQPKSHALNCVLATIATIQLKIEKLWRFPIRFLFEENELYLSYETVIII